MNHLTTSFIVLALCCTSLLQAQSFRIVVDVRAHDGTALQASHASLTQYGVGTAIKIPPSRSVNDRHEFTVSTQGTYWIRVAGTHHRAFSAPVLVDEDPLIAFEVRLGTLSNEMKTPDSVFVTGSFNDYSLDSRPVRMVRQKNGVYTAVIETPDDSLVYRPLLFLKGDGIPVDAPAATRYRYDSTRFTVWLSGNYYATEVTSKKKTKISFRPEDLLTSDLPAVLHFKNAGSPTATLLAAYANADFRIMKFRLASYNFLETRQLGNYEDFLRSYPTNKDLSYLSSMASATSDKLVQDVYNLASFHFTPGDSSRARNVLATLTPDAIVWRMGYSATRVLFNALADKTEAASFAEKIAQHEKNPGLKAGYLQFALEVCHEADENSFARLYNVIMKEFKAYPAYLESLKSRYPINRNIAVGKSIPNFEFSLLDKPGQRISAAALKGKTYLVDLWATWCMPCVAEMKTLHRVYDKFHKYGFTIFSLSFDEERKTVARFRQNKWKMPWYNAFAGNDKDALAKIGKIFEAQGLPRVILVNAEGVIVAIDEQTKGEKLDRILESIYEVK